MHYGIALLNGVPKGTQDNKDRKKTRDKTKRLFVRLCLLILTVEARYWTYVLTSCFIPGISACFSYSKHWQLRVQLRGHQYCMLRELSISTSPFQGQAKGFDTKPTKVTAMFFNHFNCFG